MCICNRQRQIPKVRKGRCYLELRLLKLAGGPPDRLQVVTRTGHQAVSPKLEPTTPTSNHRLIPMSSTCGPSTVRLFNI